jgi:hypothetical protein
MKSLHIVLTMLTLLALSACNEKVPVDIIDQNQTISRDNATLNAKRFVNARFPQATQTIVASDSSIGKDCRFGDGWASGEVFQDGKKIAKIKCQTNGRGKGLEGCLLEEDFKTKDYAQEDGRCQNLPELPKFK